MKSRGWMEIATLGSSSWMPCAPQGVKGTDDDDDDDDENSRLKYFIHFTNSHARYSP